MSERPPRPRASASVGLAALHEDLMSGKQQDPASAGFPSVIGQFSLFSSLSSA